MITRRLGHSRGAPVIIVALVLIGWATLRGLNWENPYERTGDATRFGSELLGAVPAPFLLQPQDPEIGSTDGSRQVQSRSLVATAMAASKSSSSVSNQSRTDADHSLNSLAEWTFAPAGHQILFLAALSSVPVPRAVAESRAARLPDTVGLHLPSSSRTKSDHWSIDGWALWRQGSGGELQSGLPGPIYGGSQMGAVARYNIGSYTQRYLQAYARGYAALEGSTEVEMAFGLSARPLPTLPIRAHGEWRFAKRARGSELRPAAFVTTEIPPFVTARSVQTELYAQAGYVGGEFDTFFIDLQASGTRQIAAFDLGDLEAGAGAWIGAQRGVHRVDIGPTVRLDLRLGDRPARMSIDWRERVTGNAEPKSGVAATISASF